MAAVKIGLDPIHWSTFAILFNVLSIAGLVGVQPSTTEQHLPYAMDLWGVRITGLFAQPMMLAMYGHPFFGDHACSEPQPETHGMADPSTEIQGQMCLMTVQIYRDRHYGQMCHDQDQDDF